eukprot:1863267-Rhodomonas_salina.2
MHISSPGRSCHVLSTGQAHASLPGLKVVESNAEAGCSFASDGSALGAVGQLHNATTAFQGQEPVPGQKGSGWRLSQGLCCSVRASARAVHPSNADTVCSFTSASKHDVLEEASQCNDSSTAEQEPERALLKL